MAEISHGSRKILAQKIGKKGRSKKNTPPRKNSGKNRSKATMMKGKMKGMFNKGLAKSKKAAAAAGVKLDNFSNYTLDNAADFANLKSTIIALDTNENIKRSMRASEYAKTAPAGSTLMTNHLDTAAVVNNNSPVLAGIL